MQAMERRLVVAVGLSMLLHGAFLALRTGQHPALVGAPYVARIDMRWLPRVVPRPTQAAVMAKPVTTRNAVSRASARREMPHAAAATPVESVPQVESSPPAEITPGAEGSLYDRARAGLRSAEREAMAEPPKDLVKRKALPANLAPQPEEPLNKFAERFEAYLGDTRVLSVREHQEGNNRVTMIHTNRGNYCYYQPLLTRRFMENMPTIGKFGDCSPQP